ncbi:MAG: hypothetical protein R3E10_12835 [Gemmatimonadota bacterium]
MTRALRRAAARAGLALLLTTLANAPLTAQALVGVRGGWSSTTVRMRYGNPLWRHSGTVGGWARLPLTADWSIQVEGQAVRRGFDLGPPDEGLLWTGYEFPVLIKRFLSRRASDAAYITVGAVPAQQRSCVYSTTDPLDFPTRVREFDCDLYHNPDSLTSEAWEWGALLGVGTELSWGALRLTLDARTVVGLTRLVEFTALTSGRGQRAVVYPARSIAGQLLVGVAYPPG